LSFLAHSEGSENLPDGFEKLPDSSEIQICEKGAWPITAMKKQR